MASGSGLKKNSVSIPESEYPIVDIISCVKFDDIYGFFSMRESLEETRSKGSDLISDDFKLTSKMKINKGGSFIYPENARISSEMKKKLKTMKDYVSVYSDVTDKLTGIKITIRGNNTRVNHDIFASNKISESINQRKGKLPVGAKFGDLNVKQFFTELDTVAVANIGKSLSKADDMFSKKNREILAEDNFQLLRVIARRVGGRGAKIDQTLDTVKEGMIHPTDLKRLQEKFVNPGGKGSFPMYLMKHSLPRFCSAELLMNILDGKSGSKTIYGGRRCWNVTNKSLEGKKALALFPNIEINESSMTVSNVNLGLFLKKEVCNGEKYELDDKVIGYLDGGYYKVITGEMLERSKREQINFFQNKFGKMEQEIITSSFVNGIKQKFKYPKKTESLLLLREDTFTPSFEESVNDPKEYVNGFYNSFGRKSGIDIELKAELIRFILFRYLGRDGKLLTEKRKEAKQIMLRIQKDVDRGKSTTSFLGGDKVTKRDIVKLIELLTYRREENESNSGIVSDEYRYGVGKSLRTFLADPNVRFGTPKGEEFPLLRSISYFVMCEYNDMCDSIFNVGDKGVFQSISYLKLPGDEKDYSLYYDRQNKYFTKTYR